MSAVVPFEAHGTPPAARLVDVVKQFPVRRPWPRRSELLRAVAGVSFDIGRGETVGLVGESGSGKSTVARLLTRLADVTDGRVEVAGDDVTGARGSELRQLRRRVQMVFQDPFSSFDPRAEIADSLAEPLETHRPDLSKHQRRARIDELLELVGLRPEHGRRRAAELSGGQLQRAAIARALAPDPQLLVLDEPVSALDVSTQAQVINLLQDLQDELGVAYLFISHDLSVVEHISHRVAVMYLGALVEVGPADVVCSTPSHPYTAALLDAVPIADPVRQRLRARSPLGGEPPSPVHPPSGCRFRSRCPHAFERCEHEPPAATTTTNGVTVYCHLHDDDRSRTVTLRPRSEVAG